MTDPARWRDGDSDAPEGAIALLEVARKTRPMTAAERSRSAKRVARIAALPVAAGVLASLKGLAAAAGIGAGSALVLVGAFTVVEARLDGAEPEAPASAPVIVKAPPGAKPAGPVPLPSATTSAEPVVEMPPARPAPVPSASQAAAREPAPETSASAGAPSSTTAASATSSAAAEMDPLVREALLLDQAQRLLSQSPAEALARLNEHARQFPAGKLGIERELFTIDALRRLGRGAEARARGEALLARTAGGPYEARVRRMVGGEQ